MRPRIIGWLVVLAGLCTPSACVGPDPVQGVTPPGVASDGWLERAQRHVAEREYRASETERGLQAPNRAHNLRTWFEKTGIRVHDRTADGSPQLLRLSLAGLGRGTKLAPLVPGEVSKSENRVEIRRPGLVEWYVNSEAGLEQGFTLDTRPAGQGPLVVELAVTGNRAAPSGDAIVFETEARRLRYGELHTTDAAGRVLASHLELIDAQRLRIVVDEADATYPVVIDPLLTETPDAQLESDQQEGLLGFSVAGAGDVNADGYADVIVGAYGYDTGATDAGAAFVFLGSSAGIADADPATAAARLESDDADGQFGYSVAGAGDVNGDGHADVIVGAPRYDAGLGMFQGAAFVFYGGASGIASGGPATAGARLASDQAGGLLGQSVAGAGDVNGDGYADVIAGAYGYDAGSVNEGAAFVFLGSASGIASGTSANAAAQLESDQAEAGMGTGVAGAGDVNGDGYDDVIVGGNRIDSGELDEGAAFVFLGSASGIADGNPGTAAAELESNQAQALMGLSVAGAGDVNGDGYADVIVGSHTYNAGLTWEGAAFVFLGSASGIANGNPATAAAQLESNQQGAFLGASVAGARDVNGDGYADVIVGADLYDGSEGAAFVFLGSASGVADGNPATAAAHLEPGQSNALFGRGVAGAGDVNGDGYSDVIVGAYWFTAGESHEGAAFVYHGSLPEPGLALSLACGIALVAALARRRGVC